MRRRGRVQARGVAVDARPSATWSSVCARGLGLVVVGLVLTPATPALGADGAAGSGMAWGVWPSVLFAVTFLLGIVAVLAGLGGATVFVPIVSGFFPFHLDFVRAAGLLVALSGALAAGPALLERRLADVRLALPVALVASGCAVIGAMIGLALPTKLVQTGLGVIAVGIVVVMLTARRSDFPQVSGVDRLAQALDIAGVYYEPSLDKHVAWAAHRTWQGLALFVLIGLMAGMFGIGAGWANVPALNLVMGVPLKIAVGTSVFLLSITDTSAAWVYLNQGAMLPMLVVPSVVGMMLGSQVGVRILATARPHTIRRVVVVLLLFAGGRALLKGLGIWE